MLGFKHRHQAFKDKKQTGMGHCQASEVSTEPGGYCDIGGMWSVTGHGICLFWSHTMAYLLPLPSAPSQVSVTWNQDFSAMIVTGSFQTCMASWGWGQAGGGGRVPALGFAGEILKPLRAGTFPLMKECWESVRWN